MLMLLIALASVPGAEAAPAGRVVAVTVFPDHAVVTRRLRVPCPAGAARATFDHLPPAARADSFHARAGNARVVGLSQDRQRRSDAFSARAAALDERLRRLDGALAAARQELARIDATAENAHSFEEVARTLVTRQMGRGAPVVDGWRRALDAVEEGALGAARARTPVAARLRQAERDRTAVAGERAALAASAARSEQLVDVVLACEGGPADVDLSYLVEGASWAPAYEVRVRGQGEGLELTTLATVRQRTGEDWRQARLSLSTARPRQDATPPAVERLAVYAEDREPPEPRIVARVEEVPHAAGADAAATASGARWPVVLATEETAVELTVPEPADVPADGASVRVVVARQRLAADPHLRATPKLAPHVFRIVDAANGAGFPLLAGPVDVYRDGSLVGRQRLEEVPARGRFTVGLGVEPGLTVRRLVLAEVDRSAGLLGGARRHEFAYRFELENHLSRTAAVELGDHLPVSELEDVAVVVDRRTTAGYTRDPDGLVRWRLSLAAGASAAVDLAFRVEVPSRYR